MDAGTDWEVKEELSAAAADLAASSVAAASPTAITMRGLLVGRIEELSFIRDYLALPVVLDRFLAHWKPSWRMKWPASATRVNFDLHRASGLWLWPLLFVFGWSRVMSNLDQVYRPVTERRRTIMNYSLAMRSPPGLNCAWSRSGRRAPAVLP